MTWQRRARLIVAVFLLVFAVVLYLAIGTRPDPVAPAPTPRTDPAALTETAAGTLTFLNGETIAFEHALSYADGRSSLRGVIARIPQQDGRTVTVTAREALQRTSGSRFGQILAKGDVEVTTSDGLHVTTAEADYDETTALVRAPGRVEFQSGRLSGSGVGATYDAGADRLSLLSQAQVAVAPDASGGENLAVTAGSAHLARREHLLGFEEDVRIERTDRVIEAAQATLHLTDDDSRLTVAELRGGARVARPEGTGTQPGALALMQATDMDLHYAEDGRTLRQTALREDAAIELAGDAGGAERRIRAGRLDVDLGPDGATVTRLAGWDGVRLDLPAPAGGPTQTILASALDAQGSERDGLSTARFVGSVEFRESSGATKTTAAYERVARSPALALELRPQMGGVASARFSGGVRFTDGAWQAEAPEASYDPERGVLTLAGAKAPPLPRIADDRITVDATAVELALTMRRVVAEGRVQSVFHPAAKDRPLATSDATRVPAMLDDTQPVYVTGEKLVYDGQASVATYSGGARLWQGDSLIVGETITVDDRRGNLTASGQVRSTLLIGDARRAASAPGRTTGEGAELQYDDTGRRAVYVGEPAHVNGPQGDLKAGRIELLLAEHGRELARVEAYEEITVHIEGGYTARGTRLTYFTESQRYHMQGQPVRILEEKRQGCRETIGVVLTFTRSTDTINVDGTDGNRSRTRPVPCAERRH